MSRKLDREKWEAGLVKKKGSERGGEVSAVRAGAAGRGQRADGRFGAIAGS